ncbi:MAG: AMP-binding protein [Actinomycetes bacterium]
MSIVGPDVDAARGDRFPFGANEDPRGDEKFVTLPGLLDYAVREYANDIAVVDGLDDPDHTARLTFAELGEAVTEAARGFLAIGVARGDRVALWAPNCLEWIVAALGITSVGGVVVTLNTRFKGAEAAYIINNAAAKVLCTVEGFLGADYPAQLVGEDLGPLAKIVMLKGQASALPAGVTAITWHDVLAGGAGVEDEALAAARSAVAPTDMADIIFTSGTTGKPKGVVTSHAQTLRTFATWANIVGLRHGDRYLIVNPFFHTFGYKSGLLASLMAGATMYPVAVFDVPLVGRYLVDEQISVLPGPPTLFQSLLAGENPAVTMASLRLVVTGAALVPVELVKTLQDDLGVETVLTAYGLTESTGVVTMCRQGDAPEVIAKTSGRAIPHVEVRIVDKDNVEVPRGEAGEVVLRGYNVLLEYFANEAATKETIDAEGFLHTGDIAVMDEAGNIIITDRLKDMYVVGGFNAYPAEIEAQLRQHRGIAQVAVIGVPDERMGEVGCAYVVAAQGATEELGKELLAYAAANLANYKVPRYLVFIDALPLNASGKVLKRELREQFAAGTDPVVTK